MTIVELRPSEFLLNQCAGGFCAVCKLRIEAGAAVQLSRYTSRIRHVGCMPRAIQHIKRINAKSVVHKNWKRK